MARRHRERHHRRQSGPAGLHGGALHRAREPQAARDRGLLVGRPAAADDRGRELPGLPDGHHGPRADADSSATRPSASARASSPTRRRASSRATDGEPHKVWVGDDELPGAHGHPRHGRRAQEARRARRGGARRPRRLLLRHLRRGVLQGQADDHRRRRRLRDGGGDLPREVRRRRSTIVHRRDEFRASKIMLERARATREHRVPDAVRGRGVPSRARTARSSTRGCATSRPARSRELPMAGAFIAIGHEPQSEIVRGIVETDENGYVDHRGPLDAHEPARASSPPATSSTTPTARRSPPPARAVRRRSTPSGTCATTRGADARRARGHGRPRRGAVGAARPPRPPSRPRGGPSRPAPCAGAPARGGSAPRGTPPAARGGPEDLARADLVAAGARPARVVEAEHHPGVDVGGACRRPRRPRTPPR